MFWGYWDVLGTLGCVRDTAVCWETLCVLGTLGCVG